MYKYSSKASTLPKISNRQKQPPSPGLSNQEMLSFLNAGDKHRLSSENEIRNKLSERFNVDFGNLKLYRDVSLNQVGEKAYTKGDGIHLSSEVDPYSNQGMQIINHEAAHVIQQGTGGATGSGILHSDSLEAEANNVADNYAQIDTTGFAMPTAQGAPVQGFLDFLFNNKKRNKARANELLEETERADSNSGNYDEATSQSYYDKLAGQLAKAGIKSGGYYTSSQARKYDEYGQSKAQIPGGRERFERELLGGTRYSEHLKMPKNLHTHKLAGVSPKLINQLVNGEEEGYDQLRKDVNTGADFLSKTDFTKMSDREYLKNYHKIMALQRHNISKKQLYEKTSFGKAKLSDDADASKEFEDSSYLMEVLSGYHGQRMKKIAGKTSEDEGFSEDALQLFEGGYKERLAAVQERNAPKKRSFLSRLFGK